MAAGRDILLEGPPGTSKTTLLRAITAEWGIPLVFVEGNADLTPAKLVGHHNPARVLREDYSPDNFVHGPLLDAMRAGGFLYIEEFNRAPEDTLNTLLTAMAERQIAVPRAGTVTAAPTFRVVASMNPYDNVGTTRLSTSVHDRLCRLAIGYQDAAAERGIVALRAPLPARPRAVPRLVADAVAVTRATREHPDIRQGSSVRGAIDLALVAGQLLELRGRRRGYPELVFDAMVVALSGRILLDEAVEATPEAVLRRSGRTSSSWPRPRPRRVEEQCRPTRRAAPGRGPAARRRRCAGGRSSSTRSRCCSSAAPGRGRGLVLAAAPGAGGERDRGRQRRARRTAEAGALWRHRRDREAAADPRDAAPAPQIAARLACPGPPGRHRAARRRRAGQRPLPGRLGRHRPGPDGRGAGRAPAARGGRHHRPRAGRTRRSVVLLVDVSGSMRGERVRTAAATVGALAGELGRDDLAVMAFWSDAAC